MTDGLSRHIGRLGLASSQKFIARTRAPRVQIEYDLELYSAQKSFELLFVIGVLADLSGRLKLPLPGLEQKKMQVIDSRIKRPLNSKTCLRVVKASKDC